MITTPTPTHNKYFTLARDIAFLFISAKVKLPAGSAVKISLGKDFAKFRDECKIVYQEEEENPAPVVLLELEGILFEFWE